MRRNFRIGAHDLVMPMKRDASTKRADHHSGLFDWLDIIRTDVLMVTLGLQRKQPCITTVRSEQFDVCALLDDASVLKD